VTRWPSVHACCAARSPGSYAAYKLRLSRLRTGLGEVDSELAEARHRLAQVEQATGAAPQSTEDFAVRVGRLDARIAQLKPRIDATAAAQEHVLADIAVRELEAQKARLASYATQAQFALAALYDGAASAGAQ
jgi:chromosome segregation ATPase